MDHLKLSNGLEIGQGGLGPAAGPCPPILHLDQHLTKEDLFLNALNRQMPLNAQ